MNMERLRGLYFDTYVIKRGVPAIYRVTSKSIEEAPDDTFRVGLELRLGTGQPQQQEEITHKNMEDFIFPEDLPWETVCAILLSEISVTAALDRIRRSI